ncbi:MAG: ATP-dependent DNA helicase [Acidobacteriaceae bacterium]
MPDLATIFRSSIQRLTRPRRILLESKAVSAGTSEIQRIEPADPLLAVVRERHPLLLIHGGAGTGKTTLVQKIKSSELRVIVLAPTGVAALSAGGQTIHSFFSLPPGIINAQDIRWTNRIRTVLNHLDLIIVDEISMVRADLVDAISRALKVNMQNDRPFGGIPVLLVGDFLQLPPIASAEETEILSQRGYQSHYAFGARNICGQPIKVIELNTVYRQQDPLFIELLQQVRCGRNLEAVVQTLNERCCRPHRASVKPILLTPRNEDAESYNRAGLGALPGESALYQGSTDGDFGSDRLPAPEFLYLKLNARVMMTKNYPGKKWVNGTLGTCTRLSEDRIWVKFDGSATEQQVDKTVWESVKYRYDPLIDRASPRVVGTYTQLPVRPAWAITIHKSQGLTLEDVRLDLGLGAFSPGQTYVAISRATSLEGLSFARPLTVSDVIVDHSIVDNVAGMEQWAN